MRKLFAVIFLALFTSALALAQKGHSKDLGGDFFGEEAFLSPVKLVAGTGSADLTFARYPDTDCPPDTLNVYCFAVTDPDTPLDKTLKDVTHVVIPGRSLRNVLLIEARNFTTLAYRTDLTYPDNASFLYTPTITIESPALTSPIVAGVGRRRVTRMVFPGEDGNDDLQYSREYRLTRSLLKIGFGYTDEVIDAFFASDITIRLNVRIRAREVDYADGMYDLMIYGN